MSRHSAVTGTLAAALLFGSSLASFGQDSSGTARVVKYFGYEKAIELRNETTRVVLCPQVGGRVLEYSLNGTNSLFVSDEEKAWKPGDRPEASAGRFDIGPELVIPRRPTLWSGEWSAEITGTRSARLTSRRDEATGVQLVRDFVLDDDSSRLLCTQTIRNVSNSVKEWCHWSRTFATGEGICVIPLSEPSRFPNKYVMYEEGGVINARPEDDNIRVRDGFLEILGAPRKPKLGFDSYAATRRSAFQERVHAAALTTHSTHRLYRVILRLNIPLGDFHAIRVDRLVPGCVSGVSAGYGQLMWERSCTARNQIAQG